MADVTRVPLQPIGILFPEIGLASTVLDVSTRIQHMRLAGEDALPIWTVIAVAVLSIAASNFAKATEIVKVVVPHRGSWDTSYTELGIEQGFFREYGLDLKLTYTANSAANQQKLISGSADIAIATRFLDVLIAYTRGAPIWIVSAELTGAPDVFWYAKIAGPIASLKDLHGKAVSYSSPGSSSNLILLKLLNEARIDDAKLIPIGLASSGYTDILNAQLEASWASPPTVMNELLSGEIRVIARGNVLERMANGHPASRVNELLPWNWRSSTESTFN
jgi:NitT/TauT family transport system substrate-binding protein